MNVIHNGTNIEYDETKNTWEFTLRGRERSAESLVKAKEFIDRPVKEESNFKPIEAWHEHQWRNGDYKKVTITSFCVPGKYEQHAWIRHAGGTREKVAISSLYLLNPANDAIVEEVLALEKEASRLAKKAEAIAGKLKRVPVPKDEGADE